MFDVIKIIFEFTFYFYTSHDSPLWCTNLSLTRDEVYLIPTYVIKLVSGLSGDVTTIVIYFTGCTHYFTYQTNSLEACVNL